MTSARKKRNPYIIGRSIDEPKLFFGRENLFPFIEDNLSNHQQVILLHGQRRIGKSSVLQQIPKKVNLDKFIFVLSDFQAQGQWSLHDIIYQLAKEICEELEIDVNTIDLALISDLEKDANKFRELLHPIFQKLGNRNLVLLLDEFDVLNSNNNDSGFKDFFKYLRQLVFQEKRLFIIPVVGRRLNDMPQLLELFKGAPQLRIRLLDKVSTETLIRKPARGTLEYTNKAIDKIFSLSAGHPYFIQAICYALFAQAREQRKNQITESDVETVIDNAIELSEAGLVWFRDGLSIPEIIVFSAVAEAQERARQSNQSPQHPLNLLANIGVNVNLEELQKAQPTLIDNDFLDVDGNRITVEFVRRWLVKSFPLKSGIKELEKLNPQANDYYEMAHTWREQGKIDDELYHYRKALELNPNHFSALFQLAETYQKNQKFSEAIELYERAFKIHPERVKEDYIKSLLGYGNHLMQEKNLMENDLSQVKKPFNKILEIEPNHRIAQQQLKILTDKEKPINPGVSHGKKLKPIPIGLVILTAVLAFPLLISIGMFLGKIIITQPVSDSRFSSGERTLFDKANDNNYNEPISECNQKFKDQNYDEAASCFQALKKDYDTEPEPLIYYNNSLAHKRDNNPLTIAVVVSTDDSDQAKEILRGVAQAQNKYNENKDNMLLEVIILNDSNDSEISKKIARKIVKDQDILGVIGHNSSNATKAALKVYGKEKLPVISSTSTSTDLQGNNFFRTVINNSAIAKKLAEYIKLQPKEKVAIFYNGESSYSKDMKKNFAKELGDFTEVKSINLDLEKDINKKISSVVKNKFKVGILFSSVKPEKINLAIEVAKANNEQSKEERLSLFGGDSLYDCDDILKKSQQEFIGLILAVPWHKDLYRYRAKPFLNEVREQWKTTEISWRTATSYDAAKAFIYALSNSGDNPTRAKVLEQLKEVNVPAKETSSGENLRFNREGEIIGEAILVEVVEDSTNKVCSNLDFSLVD